MSDRKFFFLPYSDENPRSGEGSAVLLKDGSVYFAYSHFAGAHDHSFSILKGGHLDLERGTLTDPVELFHDETAINQMSISLERLKDGSIGIVYLRKTGEFDDVICFARSFDECRTWSAPKVISDVMDSPYMVVNNDRLRCFSSGRIAVPVNGYYDLSGKTEPKRSWLQLLYSDDFGESWQVSERLKPCSDPWMPEGHECSPETWKLLCDELYREQEPGVEEMPDGRLLYYCRTYLGTMHYAFSEDGGKTFSELQSARDLISPLSPQSIRRIPGTSRLLCIWNDHKDSPWYLGGPRWWERTPLTVAYSDDNARSWHKLREIENTAYNYCYTSMLFLKDRLLLSYYESENRPNGTRRNLASLKMQLLDLANLK